MTMRWRTVAGVLPVEGMDRARLLSWRTLASLSDCAPRADCLGLVLTFSVEAFDLALELDADAGMGLKRREDLSIPVFLFLNDLLDCGSGWSSRGPAVEGMLSTMSVGCIEISTETSREQEDAGLSLPSWALQVERASRDDRVGDTDWEVVDKPAVDCDMAKNGGMEDDYKYEWKMGGSKRKDLPDSPPGPLLREGDGDRVNCLQVGPVEEAKAV